MRVILAAVMGLVVGLISVWFDRHRDASSPIIINGVPAIWMATVVAPPPVRRLMETAVNSTERNAIYDAYLAGVYDGQARAMHDEMLNKRKVVKK